LRNKKLHQFAEENNLQFRTVSNGVGFLFLPSTEVVLDGVTQKATPVLVTGDEGRTWAPELMIKGRPQWKNKTQLTGVYLELECNHMYAKLGLCGIAQVLQIVDDLAYVFGD
jgi:hypothetical protein